MGVSSQRRALVMVVTALALAGAGREAAAQPVCLGDCNGNRQVTVDELVRGVNIALGTVAVSTCTAVDRNADGSASIDELIAAVNAALNGCSPPVIVRGVCRRPGAAGLVPCAAGAAVRLSLCLDRARCLADPGARRVLRAGSAGADGRFTLFVDDEALLGGLLVLETEVGPGAVYRTLALGPPTPGSTLDGIEIAPASEAAVRLFGQYGLERFSDLSISELIAIVRAALSGLSVAGLTPAAAADLAASTAAQDGAVVGAYEARRVTPVPSATVTRTAVPPASPTHSATVAATATATLSPTPSATRTASATVTTTLTPTASATASATRTVTATPTATATFTVTATASATHTATATASVTRTPTITATPTPTLPPLNLAIEVNPNPARPGETVEVSYTITNTGGSTLSPVTLQTTLPDHIEPFTDTLASGTARCGLNQINTCQPGGTLTWHFIGSLAPGEGVTLRMPPIVAPGTPNGSALAFSGTVEAGGLVAMASDSVAVQSGLALPFDLALSQAQAPVVPGALLTYTAVYGFRAVVGQADSRLSLTLPPGTSVVAGDGGTVAGDRIDWTLGTLSPGDGGVRRITVAVDAALPLGSPLIAEAVITRADGSAAKRAVAVNRVQAAPPLGIAIDANPDPARPGEPVEVMIHLTNPGLAAVTATLDLVVPDLVETLTDNTALGGAVCGAFTLGNPCPRRTRVRWTLTVPPRDGVTVFAPPVVTMSAPSGAVIPVQAHLVNQQGSSIAAARGAVRVDAGTAWELRLDDDRDPVAPGEAYTYRLTARHRPSSPAPAPAALHLDLPAGVTVLDAGDAVVADGRVSWDLGVLEPNDVVQRAVRVAVGAGVPGATLLAAEAVLGGGDAALGESRQRIATRVALGSPFALSLATGPDPVRPGQVLETALTVSNAGSSQVNGARVEARVPDGSEAFAAALSNGASCSAITLLCAPGEVARWNTGIIPAGQSATVRMPPRVGASAAEGSLLRFIARAQDLGVTGRDALLTRTVIVDGGTPFALALSASTDPAIGGQTFDYTLHVGRVAADPSGDTVLRLELAPGVYFVAATDGGVAAGDDAVEWALGSLAGGAGGSVTATVVVDTLPDGTPLHARATVRDLDDPFSEQRAEAVTTVGAPPLVFAVSAAPDPVAAGAPVVLSLSVTNPRASAVHNVSVEGIVPPESNGFVDTATTGGGRCGAFTSNACAPRQLVVWNLATVAAGQTVTVTMPPPIRADIAPGTVVRLVGRFRESINTPPQVLGAAVTVE